MSSNAAVIVLIATHLDVTMIPPGGSQGILDEPKGVFRGGAAGAIAPP